MNLTHAFENVTTVYFDTSSFIDYIEENPLYIEKMDKIIARIEEMHVERYMLLPDIDRSLTAPH